MTKNFSRLAVALAMAVSGWPALADDAPSPEPMFPAQGDGPRNSSLYFAVGEMPGIQALVGEFVRQIISDARLMPFFRNANPVHINQQLIAQFCELSGGPCVYQGPDMAAAHGNIAITDGDFDALVNALRRAMSKRGIAPVFQDRMVGLFTPMRGDIVNTP